MLWALKRSEAENLMIGSKEEAVSGRDKRGEADICRTGESSCLGKFDGTTRRQEKINKHPEKV